MDFLRWKSAWWKSKVGVRVVGQALDAGLRAYANRQAFQYSQLASTFSVLWTPFFEKNSVGSTRLEA